MQEARPSYHSREDSIFPPMLYGRHMSVSSPSVRGAWHGGYSEGALNSRPPVVGSKGAIKGTGY
eukprot:7837164-Pyramimonas_sp.AAC.1